MQPPNSSPAYGELFIKQLVGELLERAGKEKLAGEVLRETERALGLEPLPADSPKRRHADAEARPVRAVHFANFIIQ